MSEVIYNRIAMLRAERGISRRELTDALGVHYQTVATWSTASTVRACTSRCESPRHFEVPAEVIFSTEPFPRLDRAVPPARHSRDRLGTGSPTTMQAVGLGPSDPPEPPVESVVAGRDQDRRVVGSRRAKRGGAVLTRLLSEHTQILPGAIQIIPICSADNVRVGSTRAAPNGKAG